MKKTLIKSLASTGIAALLGAFLILPVAHAETSKLIIESGDSAQSRGQANMDKEQWDDTRSLRKKVNQRVEKEWDKKDAAFDVRDKCLESTNLNVYWEPNTQRCLDRRSGRETRP